MLAFTRTILLLSCFLAATASAQEKNYRLNLSEPNKPMFLNVELYYGNIEIMGYDGKEVEISIDSVTNKQDKKVQTSTQSNTQKNKPERATQGLKKISNKTLQVSIRESENRVNIEGERSEEFILLTIKVPKNASINADLYRGGEIHVANVSGTLELETWKAAIIAKSVTGPIVAESYDADIVVEFSQFSELNPSSIASHSGDIDITFNTDAKSQVNVQNYKGEIFSGLNAEFVSQDQVKRTADSQSQEIIIGNMLSASINGGNQTLTLVSYSGDFYLRQ